jgi:hypothetical protein
MSYAETSKVKTGHRRIDALALPLAGGGNSGSLSLKGEGWGAGDLLPDQLFKEQEGASHLFTRYFTSWSGATAVFPPDTPVCDDALL